MPRLIVNYTKLGWTCPDHKVLETADRLAREGQGCWVTSTGLLVEAIRALVVEGKVPLDEIEFQWEGVPVPMGPDGDVAEWREGYCDLAAQVNERLLRAGLQRREARRQEEKDA